MEEKKTYEELETYIRELENKRKENGNREYKSRLFSFPLEFIPMVLKGKIN